MRLIQTALLCAALAACAGAPELPVTRSSEGAAASTAPTDLSATYSPLRTAGGRVFTLNPALSEVRIYAFRAGKAAKRSVRRAKVAASSATEAAAPHVASVAARAGEAIDHLTVHDS